MPPRRMLAACAALTDLFTAAGSRLQSGKCAGLRVRHSRTAPCAFLSPWTRISRSEGPCAAARPRNRSGTKIAETAVGAAKPVPETEIKPIIASILLVMALVVAGRDQPVAGLAPDERTGKQLPAHVIGDAHD